MQNTKILGLVAVLASALAAFVGAAPVAASNFTAGAAGKAFEESTVTNHVFTVTGSEVTCKNIVFTGKTSGTTSTEETVEPSYSECTAFGFPATVNTAGCKYTLKAATDESGMATVGLSGCTFGGIAINVNVPSTAKCTVFIPNQSISSAVSYSNFSPGDTRVSITASNIAAEVTTSTGLCPLTVAKHTNASYAGVSTVQASGTTVQYDNGAEPPSSSQFTAGIAGKDLEVSTATNHVFSVTGSEVTCKKVEFTGATSGTNTTEQTVFPSYSECTAFGFANATVNTAGCSYTFRAETDESGHATVNLRNCINGGIKIVVNAPFIAKCTVFVPHQSISSAGSYSNFSASDMRVSVTASNIAAEVTTSTGLCPLSLGSHSNASYTGVSTVQAAGTAVRYDAEPPSSSSFTASDVGKAIEENTVTAHAFSFTGYEVTCKSNVFKGTILGTSTNEEIVSPSYSECTAFGFGNVTVNTAGCEYTLKAVTDGAGMATVGLSGCTAGGITIKANVPWIAKCTVFIPNQSVGSAVSYSNLSASDMRVSITATTISSEVTTSTGLCPLSLGKHNNASYAGVSTVQASGTTVQYDA